MYRWLTIEIVPTAANAVGALITLPTAHTHKGSGGSRARTAESSRTALAVPGQGGPNAYARSEAAAVSTVR